MTWRLICACAAEKDLDALDRVAARRILPILHRFSETGHADVARIVNARTPHRRISVGPYRIVVLANEELKEAEIIRIRRRDSATKPSPPAGTSPRSRKPGPTPAPMGTDGEPVGGVVGGVGAGIRVPVGDRGEKIEELPEHGLYRVGGDVHFGCLGGRRSSASDDPEPLPRLA